MILCDFYQFFHMHIKNPLDEDIPILTKNMTTKRANTDDVNGICIKSSKVAHFEENYASVSTSNAAKPKVLNQHWTNGLKASMNDQKSIIFKDDSVVAIIDKYPKVSRLTCCG